MTAGTGNGEASTGQYRREFSTLRLDRDVYAVDLRKGDVLGAVVRGAGNGLTVLRSDGRVAVNMWRQALTALYPSTSPLPSGGNATLAYVAEWSGSFYVEVTPELGAYTLGLEAYRPGAETDPLTRTQTLHLDFDGAGVDAGGEVGPRDLSLFRTYLSGLGLAPGDEAEMIDRITRVSARTSRTTWFPQAGPTSA